MNHELKGALSALAHTATPELGQLLAREPQLLHLLQDKHNHSTGGDSHGCNK